MADRTYARLSRSCSHCAKQPRHGRNMTHDGAQEIDVRRVRAIMCACECTRDPENDLAHDLCRPLAAKYMHKDCMGVHATPSLRPPSVTSSMSVQ